MIFGPGKNIYFSTYPPPALIHFSHRFTSASKPAAYKSFGSCLSHFRTSATYNLFVISETFLAPFVNCFTQL
jgi:hypothetical protein